MSGHNKKKYHSFKEMWDNKETRYLFLYGLLLFFSIFLLEFIANILINRSLLILYGSMMTIPVWIGIYYKFKNLRKVKINGKFRFGYGRIFEYIFFLFLFGASFFLTFITYFSKEYYTINEFDELINVLLGFSFFLINAIISGYFHYVLEFHD